MSQTIFQQAIHDWAENEFRFNFSCWARNYDSYYSLVAAVLLELAEMVEDVKVGYFIGHCSSGFSVRCKKGINWNLHSEEYTVSISWQARNGGDNVENICRSNCLKETKRTAISLLLLFASIAENENLIEIEIYS